MSVALGILAVLASVVGGFVLAGGKLDIVLQALPYELLAIGGSAAGIMAVANGPSVLSGVARDVVRASRRRRWGKADYEDLLCLLHSLAQVSRKGSPKELERHVEHPESSALFRRHSRVLADPFAVALICDTLRMMMLDVDDPMQVEDALDRCLRKRHDEALRPARALAAAGDALPALGIVAAVMGIIKTMGAIDGPPAVIGQLIGGALVGTFLGILLSYGIAAPLAARMRRSHDEDAEFHAVIRDVIVAHLHGHPPQVCAEVGRKIVPSEHQPTYSELEAALRALPPAVEDPREHASPRRVRQPA